MVQPLYSDNHRQLVSALQDPSLWGGEAVELIETHISSVLLVGGFAYKIKKPLDLGFLDFSTLERRRHFCLEEIRLNRRLAPDVYLGVTAITGSVESPILDGPGEVIEYAVRMRRFPKEGLLSLQADQLAVPTIDAIASRLARFHSEIEVAGPAVAYGEPATLFAPMQHNFEQIGQVVKDSAALERLAMLEAWTRGRYQQLQPQLAERKADGFIRECHGDLHLGNITLEAGKVLIFDGIEFSPELRWIDTISELAFLTMDLEEKGRDDLSGRLLNSYLELTGDYPGLLLLRFYQVYRAMVRAKVSLIRLGQEGVPEEERQQIWIDFFIYLALAEGYTETPSPALVITHGLSGSGKSTQAARCVEQISAVRLRSDVERKRLVGLASADASDSTLDGGIYTADLSDQTYQRLLELAGQVVSGGFVALVDATFLKRRQRQLFEQLAASLVVPYVILDFKLPADVLRSRIEQRQREGGDPSEADLQVLEQQIANEEPLTDEEQGHALTLGSAPLNPAALRVCLAHGGP